MRRDALPADTAALVRDMNLYPDHRTPEERREDRLGFAFALAMFCALAALGVYLAMR